MRWCNTSAITGKRLGRMRNGLPGATGAREAIPLARAWRRSGRQGGGRAEQFVTLADQLARPPVVQAPAVERRAEQQGAHLAGYVVTLLAQVLELILDPGIGRVARRVAGQRPGRGGQPVQAEGGDRGLELGVRPAETTRRRPGLRPTARGGRRS